MKNLKENKEQIEESLPTTEIKVLKEVADAEGFLYVEDESEGLDEWNDRNEILLKEACYLDSKTAASASYGPGRVKELSELKVAMALKVLFDRGQGLLRIAFGEKGWEGHVCDPARPTTQSLVQPADVKKIVEALMKVPEIKVYFDDFKKAYDDGVEKYGKEDWSKDWWEICAELKQSV